MFILLFVVLALSSVLNRRIFLYYPDFGPEKYHSLFNQMILPRGFLSSNSDPSYKLEGELKLNILLP